MTNTCNNCIYNKVCNHDLFGFEKCGNFVPFNDVHRRKEEEKKFLILVVAMSRNNDGFVWMPELIRWYSDVFNTGCIFCAFGCHLEKEPSRFQRLKETHPRQYEYCIGGGEYDENGIWKPNKQGLGMGHIFDELNKIYGDGFIKY